MTHTEQNTTLNQNKEQARQEARMMLQLEELRQEVNKSRQKLEHRQTQLAQAAEKYEKALREFNNLKQQLEQLQARPLEEPVKSHP
ncbi:hypothetical protein EI42_03868 [Thermosporothrix hazakensis]|jgi:DNA repair exonuclease SbcCD ATPase subunit|uniref:Uncharacterized protein n=1 Tax=Thermosporothrix hazakensis TaxID=644383 RepID=A0A326UH37_THEHA|nr:hypothetical protein [Thermosporothrix hazakensis]PZW26716.1 hypothetical protein EI42_03868 [Thermosporothrix hazakensis]GCE47585.1 hypothetical protein KTH_24540 [Thermosporothrix hazakensis]